MNVTICTAISLDGFSSTSDGDTSWVLDNDQFEQALKDYSCVVMGKTTYDEIKEVIEEFTDVQFIVLTHQAGETDHSNVVFADSVQTAKKTAEDSGCKDLLVIGGSKTNESFLRETKVDKLIVDVHPLLIEDGKPAFGKMNRSFRFEQVSATAFPEGFTQIVYKVKE